MYLSENTLLQGGKYKIVRFISAGGFGCTYEAEHVMLHKRVAIKEFFVKDFCNRDETTSQISVGITSKTALVDKLKKKFIEEAQSLCSLDHPNIVHVFDVFEDNGTAYYVMDYIDGPSLNELVKKDGPMSEQKALGYIRQVADALKYVHSRNRLHLDIKPGNIMVDEKDRAILIDFGASKQYDEEAGENTSTLLGKTPGYAPLEQMGNDVVKFLPSTDIYALGATLYKLLTGVTPPSASLLASGETLEEMPSSISAGTRNAIIQSMQTNKMKRPQSVDEFSNMLTSRDMKSSSRNNNSMLAEDSESDNTIIEEKSVEPANKKKARTVSKERKTNIDKKEGTPVPGNDTNSINTQGVKLGFWLKFFLFVICASGIGSLLVSLLSFSTYGSVVIAVGMIILGIIQSVLGFITLNAFRKRRPDAVFLGKLCVIIPFVVNIVTLLTADSISSMPDVVKSLVYGIIWFVYLCVSKRVGAVIPSSSRKLLKRDYIFCAILAIFALYFFVFSNIESEIYASVVENESYVFEDNKGKEINFVYTGPTVDGVPQGRGSATYPLGQYEGDFVAGFRNGEGIFKDKEGGTFEGTFKDNYYSIGRYTRADGVYYEGTFQNQQPYNGTWHEKNGTIITEVKNGK